MPRPIVNLFSGGLHAGGQVAIQDVLVVPLRTTTAAEAMEAVSAVYSAASDLCAERFGYRGLVADEGGLAPEFTCPEQMIETAVEAIVRAGFEPGADVGICVDLAATHFWRDGGYELDGAPLTSAAMTDRVAGWIASHPIVGVEDPLAEDDWDGWPLLTGRVGGEAVVIGDDLLATNPERIRRAISAGAANGLLLKPNQIGTLTEALEALRLARSAGWNVTASARSGETEDDWLADLAHGWAADWIKVGSITRSERLAKYNRMLAIEAGLPGPSR